MYHPLSCSCANLKFAGEVTLNFNSELSQKAQSFV